MWAKNQMYSSDQYIDADRLPNVQNGFIDINSLFWSKIFSPKHVSKVLDLAKNRLTNDISPKVQAVLHKPKVFYQTYLNALSKLELPVTEQTLFDSLETFRNTMLSTF